MNLRVGLGYDVHRLVPERPLWIGGVRIDAEKGLDGHSDADVLLHAICDALLGATGDGDIGQHFPNTDPAYENISSLELLRRVHERVRRRGRVVNIDAMVIAERPRLAPHIPAMRQAIAQVLNIAAGDVGVKATTNERLGAIGAGQGIAAHAVALVELTADTSECPPTSLGRSVSEPDGRGKS